MLHLQSITAKVNTKYAKTTSDVGAAVTHLKNYGHIQKHMDTGEFYFLKKNFKVNFKLGLLC